MAVFMPEVEFCKRLLTDALWEEKIPLMEPRVRKQVRNGNEMKS